MEALLAGGELDRETVLRLSRLDERELRRQLETYLRRDEIDALLVRLRALVRGIRP
jgi:hypothetical protein